PIGLRWPWPPGLRYTSAGNDLPRRNDLLHRNKGRGASGARDLEKIPPFVLRSPIALLNASPYAESPDPNRPAPVHRRTKCSPDHRRKPAGRHLRPAIAPAALYSGPADLGKFCGRTGRLAAGKPPRI